MKEYSFKNTLLLVAGITIRGFDEGDDVFDAEHSVDGFAHVVGADGIMSVYSNADNSGTVKVRLQQDSDANVELAAIYNESRNSGKLLNVPLGLLNATTGESIGGAFGYIKRMPPVKRGTKVNAQTWEIVLENLNMLFTPTIAVGLV